MAEVFNSKYSSQEIESILGKANNFLTFKKRFVGVSNAITVAQLLENYCDEQDYPEGLWEGYIKRIDLIDYDEDRQLGTLRVNLEHTKEIEFLLYEAYNRENRLQFVTLQECSEKEGLFKGFLDFLVPIKVEDARVVPINMEEEWGGGDSNSLFGRYSLSVVTSLTFDPPAGVVTLTAKGEFVSVQIINENGSLKWSNKVEFLKMLDSNGEQQGWGFYEGIKTDNSVNVSLYNGVSGEAVVFKPAAGEYTFIVEEGCVLLGDNEEPNMEQEIKYIIE